MTTNTRIFTDIDALFQAHPTTGDVTIKTNERAIKFAVKSLVLTNNYERLFHGEIGTPLKNLLFEQFDDMSIILIREAILNVLNNYEPRITVLDVVINPKYDLNSINIDIIYKIKATGATSNASVTLDRIR
jgi:phage baseplate assembly protein W